MKKRWIVVFIILTTLIPTEWGLVVLPLYFHSESLVSERLQEATKVIQTAGLLVKPYNYDYAPQSSYTVDNLTLLIITAKVLNQSVVYESYSPWALSTLRVPNPGFVVKLFKCESNQIAELLGQCNTPTLIAEVGYAVPDGNLVNPGGLFVVAGFITLFESLFSWMGWTLTYDDWKYNRADRLRKKPHSSMQLRHVKEE